MHDSITADLDVLDLVMDAGPQGLDVEQALTRLTATGLSEEDAKSRVLSEIGRGRLRLGDRLRLFASSMAAAA